MTSCYSQHCLDQLITTFELKLRKQDGGVLVIVFVGVDVRREEDKANLLVLLNSLCVCVCVCVMLGIDLRASTHALYH
jgi:hypothetical protein